MDLFIYYLHYNNTSIDRLLNTKLISNKVSGRESNEAFPVLQTVVQVHISTTQVVLLYYFMQFVKTCCYVVLLGTC